MGDGRLREAVADSGPLIHLAEIGCFQLLNFFDKLYVPYAVWLETAEQNRISRDDLSTVTNVHRQFLKQQDVTQFVNESNLTELHAGEQECLYLCWQRGVVTLLTDDLAVRDAAKRLNLLPVGSLGIVVKAYKRNDISLHDAERYIDDLYNISSLFVTRAIADLAMEQLGL